MSSYFAFIQHHSLKLALSYSQESERSNSNELLRWHSSPQQNSALKVHVQTLSFLLNVRLHDFQPKKTNISKMEKDTLP